MEVDVNTKDKTVIVWTGKETITINAKRKFGYLVAVNKSSSKPTQVIK